MIPFEPLWEQYKRIIKDNGAIVLFGSQPFTSKLIMSNLEMFKYELIWEKSRISNFLNLKKQFGKIHENILIFSKNVTNYYPLKINANRQKIDKRTRFNDFIKKAGIFKEQTFHRNKDTGFRYPDSILYFESAENTKHPTQKPLALIEYLIKTYTNEGDTVHDSCLGSGTTLEACMNTNRNCIGFELLHDWEEHYHRRLKTNLTKLDNFL